MLALKLLMRNWRSGELKLLAISLVLAVTVLSAISIFTNRLESTLLVQSNSVIGADAVVNGIKPIDQEWIAAANQQEIKQSQAAVFISVVYAGEEMQLASIKAVDADYPLRGQFEISHVPYAENTYDIDVAKSPPNVDEVWVDSRLYSALKIKLGDKITVGDAELKVTKILINEPDGVNPLSSFGARLVMRIEDLPKTQITQEGAKVSYQWLLAADVAQKLEAFIEKIKPSLNIHQKISTLKTSQERLTETLNTAKNFLLLTSVMAVLLAGVAVAIAARQFSERHTNQVALMKSLGASKGRIRALYFGQLLLLGGFASLLGLVIGFILQAFIALNVKELYHIELVPPTFYPYVLSFMSGLVCMLCFVLPALWFLPSIPPLKILRRELSINTPHIWLQAVFALLAVVALIISFSQNIKITLSATLGLVVVILMAYIVSWLLLYVSKKVTMNLGGVWRLAFAGMQKRKGQSLIQVVVFSLAIMLLLTLAIIRTSFIDEWKLQIPKNAPNHYISNMNAEGVIDFKKLLNEKNIESAPIYPDVRARLTHINGLEPTEELRKSHNAFQRELNITWSSDLAKGNEILEGVWWDSWKNLHADTVGVSVEVDVATKLGLHIGDKLRFSVGGLTLEAEIASVRSVDWKSLKQNFYFIFEPYSLDKFSPTYGTSVFIPPENKKYLNQFSRNHPNFLILDFGKVIENIKKIITQVSDGIALVLWLTIITGCLVLFAAVMGSIESRKQESGLLRALGSSRKLILGSVFIEFAILGFLSGLIAIIGAECLLLGLQKMVFNNSIQPHYRYWIASPMVGMMFISMLGIICCRSVVTTPPAIVLREAA